VARDGRGLAEQAAAARNVKESLVDGQGLDQGRDAGEDGEDLPRDLGVALAPRPDEHALGAEPPGHGRAHGAAHAEPAGLVAGGGHHAATLGRTADDDRAPGQGGVVQHLDRGIEGVHVHVQDRAARPRIRCHFVPFRRNFLSSRHLRRIGSRQPISSSLKRVNRYDFNNLHPLNY
jgi:hypothetical protein